MNHEYYYFKFSLGVRLNRWYTIDSSCIYMQRVLHKYLTYNKSYTVSLNFQLIID